MYDQYIICTVGGKPIKRSMDLSRLLPTAREVLAEGWPVFVKSTFAMHNTIEFTRDDDGTVRVKPYEFANEKWVAEVLEKFQP